MLAGTPPTYPPVPIRPSVFPLAWLPSYEATSPIGPSFVSLAKTGAPLEVQSEELVAHLNVDLLHGLSDSAFAKLNLPNVFSLSQSFAGGINLPANNPETLSPALMDSAPIDFESAFSSSQGQLTQRFRWISQPPGSASGSGARLSLLFGENGTTPTSTGLSINNDGSINFVPGQQFPASAYLGSGGVSSGPGPGNPKQPDCKHRSL